MCVDGNIKWLFSIAVPAISGFVGVIVGAWLSGRREKGQRRYAFRERQLQDFYSPLLAIRKEIDARKKLRAKIHELADSKWQKLANEAYQSSDPDASSTLMQRRWPHYEKAAKYDERKLSEEVIPTYRKMLSTFRDNLWLAEPETRPFFKTLLEYVDVLERWLADSLPVEILAKLDHQYTDGIIMGGGLMILPPEILSKQDYPESSLQPFYDHLESKHDELRTRLSNGSV
jgi:hypothetical protein